MKKRLNYNYIAIEGNIGAGKTSLAKKIAQEFNTHLILEEFEQNPFLKHFYENPIEYAFPTELSFLTDRYNQLLNKTKALLNKQQIVADYHFLKSKIFAENNLNSEQKDLYIKIFNALFESVPSPDLIVYLQKDTNELLQNIQKRGRNYEQQLKTNYLTQIENAYLNTFKNEQETSILILQAQNIDFIKNEILFNEIIESINKIHKKGITTIKLSPKS